MRWSLSLPPLRKVAAHRSPLPTTLSRKIGAEPEWVGGCTRKCRRASALLADECCFGELGRREKARSFPRRENMPPQSVFMSGQRPICHPTPSTAAQSPSHELRERRAREWSGEFRTAAAAVEWGCKITRRPPSLHPLFAALYYQKEINRLGRSRPPSHCSS